MRPIVGFKGSRSLATLLAAAILALTATTAASAATVHKKKLSLTNITITNPQTGVAVPDWVTAGQGFFKKQGLNVTLVNSPATTGDLVAALVAGSTNFIEINSGAQIIAANNGASIRTVFQAQTSTPQEIDIANSFAQAHNIPAAGNTPAQVLAQFLALKGTHATIAVSNSSAEGYAWIIAEANMHGMTAGLNQPNDDINLTSLGSVSTLIAALNSGKVAGLSNTPPNSVQPNTIEIQLYRLSPLEKTAGVYLTTNTAMIQQHPDTVQAVVNAETEGLQFILKHPGPALKTVATQFVSVGVTSPETIDYLFTSCYVPFDKNPYPTKQAYDIEVGLINAAGNGPITLPYSTFVIPKFAAAADRAFGLPVPKG